LLLQPEPAGRVLRPWRRRRARVDGRQVDPRNRQQLRDAAHRRDLHARALEAPGPDAVPAQERAPPDRGQHARIGRVSDDGFRAAVAAGVIGSESAYGSLLRSIVEVARAIFSAQRSSIFLLDEDTDELVFEALAGEEEQGLIGTRIPSGTGIAGWTLVT